ncbi:MAG TPA: hypothetical protein VHN18_14335 [Micromonosporaceae bacterium]|nr:hypothetical protein [Micromonosporaceae bacterium]
MGSGKSPTPSVQPEKPPRAVLAASTVETRMSTYKFTMKSGETAGEGAADPTTKSGHLALELVIPEDRLKATFEVLTLNVESWIKIDYGRAAGLPNVPKLPKQWMALDISKVKDPTQLGFQDMDPLEVGEVFKAIVEVRKAGERSYEGTVDLTKATDAFLVNDEHVKALGGRGVSVPFAATVDEKERLTSLEIDVPGAGDFEATTWKATYSDYGAAVSITRPNPREVVKAPAAVYRFLNS